MTVENCIRRYKEFVEKKNVKAADDMKRHILSAKKFKDHPFLEELKGELKEVETPGAEKKEEAEEKEE